MDNLLLVAATLYSGMLASVTRRTEIADTDFEGMRLAAVREAALLMADCKRVSQKSAGN